MTHHMSALEIKGYRPFRDFNASLGCLEVIAGANGSGKSSLFEFLKFLRNAACLRSCCRSLGTRTSLSNARSASSRSSIFWWRFEQHSENLPCKTRQPFSALRYPAPRNKSHSAAMTNEPAVQELLASPKLVLHLRAFERMLDEERARRERFYEEIDADQKAEFINGEVIVHSPVRRRHTDIHRRLLRLLDLHVQLHDLGFLGFEKTLIALTRNDYEPDICLFEKEKSDAFPPDQAKFPAPDFIVEILSPGTAFKDRGVKFEDYAAHGVREYWIVDPDAETVEQYALEDGAYALRIKAADGPLESAVVSGFEIPVRALFDDAVNLKVVRRLLAETNS